MSTITDENGVKQSFVHGVPTRDWLVTYIFMARGLLRDQRDMAKTTLNFKCEDPDCRRLNRYAVGHPRRVQCLAAYRIKQDLPRVRACDRTDKIGPGHPWKEGAFLCYNCALVATAKRLIDVGQRP